MLCLTFVRPSGSLAVVKTVLNEVSRFNSCCCSIGDRSVPARSISGGVNIDGMYLADWCKRLQLCALVHRCRGRACIFVPLYTVVGAGLAFATCRTISC